MQRKENKWFREETIVDEKKGQISLAQIGPSPCTSEAWKFMSAHPQLNDRLWRPAFVAGWQCSKPPETDGIDDEDDDAWLREPIAGKAQRFPHWMLPALKPENHETETGCEFD